MFSKKSYEIDDSLLPACSINIANVTFFPFSIFNSVGIGEGIYQVVRKASGVILSEKVKYIARGF
jgi:hypothetical protein